VRRAVLYSEGRPLPGKPEEGAGGGCETEAPPKLYEEPPLKGPVEEAIESAASLSSPTLPSPRPVLALNGLPPPGKVL